MEVDVRLKPRYACYAPGVPRLAALSTLLAMSTAFSPNAIVLMRVVLPFFKSNSSPEYALIEEAGDPHETGEPSATDLVQ